MDAKHCEKSPDCCHPWDDSCSCRCEGCDPKETCPDCGDRFRSHGYAGHGPRACLHSLRTRLIAAERERDSERARADRAEAALAEALGDREKVTAFDLMKRGGEWLGAARSWLQRHARNGDRVTWGSDDTIEHRFSVREIEDMAAEVAAAAMRPQPSDERLTTSLKARWKAEAALEQMRRERDNASEAFHKADTQLTEANRQLAAVRADADGVWFWQGDGHLRALLREREEALRVERRAENLGHQYRTERDAARAALATARSERDEARADAERAIRSRDHEIERANQWSADFRVIAEAVGAIHDQSMGPSHPGTVDEVLARILTMNDNARADALREAAGACHEVEKCPPLTGEDAAWSCRRRILALLGEGMGS